MCGRPVCVHVLHTPQSVSVCTYCVRHAHVPHVYLRVVYARVT